MARDEWSRDEMLIAFKLYCELPPGKMNASNPDVKSIAKLIGRTPGAVSYRLGNYAYCDPEYTKSGRKGLGNGGDKVERIWNEFSNNMEGLINEAEAILSKYGYSSGELKIDTIDSFEAFPPGWEKEQIVMARRNQSFFRETVLASYDNKCCITGIEEGGLLVASHIKPWRDSDPLTERTNPRNGLCLNALHDRAFDKGLLTVRAEDHKVILSKALKRNVDRDIYENLFGIYEDKCITMPAKFIPDGELLRYHNEFVFEH